MCIDLLEIHGHATDSKLGKKDFYWAIVIVQGNRSDELFLGVKVHRKVR
jgi:hypothetical protein